MLQSLRGSNKNNLVAIESIFLNIIQQELNRVIVIIEELRDN